MTLFVDASALIAILADEPDHATLTAALQRDPDRIVSAMSCWETVAGLRRSYGESVAGARFRVERMIGLAAMRIASIGSEEMGIALDAYQRYGKGRHAAALNMGDCFAYACAKANDARLLYKGDDFSKTDLA